MTDFDADEAIAPLTTARPRPKYRSQRSDRILAAVGVALAAAAAAFPWYVFFNEEKFGIRIAGWEQLNDLPPGSAARRPFSVSPLATPDPENRLAAPPAIDPVVTATVSSIGEVKEDAPLLQELQPMPGRSGFRLLHVANGRALIEDGNGMYMVQVGSILPDDSRLATVEQRDGKWVIITSKGEIYTAPQ
ncbi:flagellar protein [Rhizobiaceae bacterium BDR2-2]|uniref:Flagellar protein n=1 Tax=Ectorhizobium quercum TaxID=2965071 RepID=A0AAE3SUL9_9HYPH|nr:flagellar protein [Ectorhizobium quercum]MCX8996099.1 flagellar protein [Ectorhizobium quercum]